MKAWEYDVEYTNANTSISDAVKLCNQMGAEGWELIHIEGNSVRGHELIFKREVLENLVVTRPTPFPEKKKTDGRK